MIEGIGDACGANAFLLFFNALALQRRLIPQVGSHRTTGAVESKMLAQKLVYICKPATWNGEVRHFLVAAGVLFALPVFGVLTAFGVASDTQLDRLERRSVEMPLELPAQGLGPSEPATFFAAARVQSGDTVAAILQRLGVEDSAAFKFLRTEKTARSLFTKLRPGRTIQVSTDDRRQLQSLRYFFGPEQVLEVRREGGSFTASEATVKTAATRHYRSGTIRTSLFAATDEAGIPDSVATQLARIFSTDIDFHVDLRRGDRFSVAYEMLHQDGEPLAAGRVLSAEFTNAGKTFQAFLFTDEHGTEAYYSADGQNRAKSFLRSALAFTRVSSGFGGRMHPIFRNWRQHTGVDFAAPRGTPVWATADGVVEFAGVKGGYGNAIEIRHSGGIATLYAHLQGFASGVRKGARVGQGQTIGFVGSTGYATGPHLHYEFKVSGIHQDPMRVALPKAAPLEKKHLAAFTQSARAQGEQLALLRDARFGRFE